jgi:hypothetical protein
VAMNREHWSLYFKLWPQLPAHWQQVAVKCGVHERTIDFQLRGVSTSVTDTVRAIRYRHNTHAHASCTLYFVFHARMLPLISHGLPHHWLYCSLSLLSFNCRAGSTMRWHCSCCYKSRHLRQYPNTSG